MMRKTVAGFVFAAWCAFIVWASMTSEHAKENAFMLVGIVAITLVAMWALNTLTTKERD